MKIQNRAIEGFLKSPDPAIRAILVYGPDDGLMRVRAKQLGRTIVEDLNDPFNVTVLKCDDIATDPARLKDEADAFSMMGGNRLIRIEEAKDALTHALKTYLEAPAEHALVVIEAGDLGPRSPLRTLCEKAKNAATIPCYVADARNLAGTLRTHLSEEGYTVSQDALLWLSNNLAGDHGRAMSEINKLIVYMAEKKHIDLSDVQTACGSGGDLALDDFVFSLCDKNTSQMLRCFQSLTSEGVPMISLIRALQNHLRRLHITSVRVQNGNRVDEALGQLVPKIFFKYETAFKSQLRNWNIANISHSLQKLSELEARTKQTGAPLETLCAQAFLSLTKTK